MYIFIFVLLVKIFLISFDLFFCSWFLKNLHLFPNFLQLLVEFSKFLLSWRILIVTMTSYYNLQKRKGEDEKDIYLVILATWNFFICTWQWFMYLFLKISTQQHIKVGTPRVLNHLALMLSNYEPRFVTE